MNETTVTIIGNITDDPELRFTPSGAAVANFTVAATARKWDKNSNEFVDEPTLFWRTSVWRAPAENVAESLRKGMRVIVHGKVRLNEWEDREGNKRTDFVLDAYEVGASLTFATAQITRAQRSGGGAQGGQSAPQGGQQGGGGPQGQGGYSQAPQQGGQQGGYTQPDPWGQPSDEPPF